MPIDEVLARLKAERSGILNWLIAGALEWLETRTIPQPSAMAEVLKPIIGARARRSAIGWTNGVTRPTPTR
jgi:hypothetical protein